MNLIMRVLLLTLLLATYVACFDGQKVTMADMLDNYYQCPAYLGTTIMIYLELLGVSWMSRVYCPLIGGCKDFLFTLLGIHAMIFMVKESMNISSRRLKSAYEITGCLIGSFLLPTLERLLFAAGMGDYMAVLQLVIMLVMIVFAPRTTEKAKDLQIVRIKRKAGHFGDNVKRTRSGRIYGTYMDQRDPAC